MLTSNLNLWALLSKYFAIRNKRELLHVSSSGSDYSHQDKLLANGRFHEYLGIN